MFVVINVHTVHPCGTRDGYVWSRHNKADRARAMADGCSDLEVAEWPGKAPAIGARLRRSGPPLCFGTRARPAR